MMKIDLIKWVCVLLLCISLNQVYAQHRFQGVVRDAQSGLGLPDVNILDERSGLQAVTDSVGKFVIVAADELVNLRFSKMGYEQFVHQYLSTDPLISVRLSPGTLKIDEVEINNGYQWIPRDRATGSFVHVGKEQLEAIPGRSVIAKLDGIMPGLQFDKRATGPTSTGRPVITVRGMNTFNAGTSAPLVVVDNFPFEGDIESINPNDVESITMLRDAAAASIWGARAGNGVLVINLKKPDRTGKIAVNWSSNISITGRPDLYYDPAISSTDFVDVELFLYDQNYYRAALTGSNAHRTVFSPVVQARYDLELNKISQTDLDSIILAARTQDYRDDLMAHYYRNAIHQQHHFSVSKKTGAHSLRFSAGFDQVDGANNMAIGNQKDARYSFNLFNQYEFTKRFSASLNLSYYRTSDHSVGGYGYPYNPQGGKIELYPYARLIDQDGQALVVPRGLNLNYVDTVGQGQLLDWRFRLLDDKNHQFTESTLSRLSPSLTLRYNPFASLNMEAVYSGDFQDTKTDVRLGVGSYEVRNNVNLFTEVKGDLVQRHFPLGEIYDPNHTTMTAHKLRLNTSMNESLFGNHRLTWIFGGELSDVQTSHQAQRVYGYNPFTSSSVPVNHVQPYPMFLGGSAPIPSGQRFGWGVRRLVSFFGNASYSVQDKYIVSGSIRRDASNVFGIKAIERWNPLWSIGASWNMHKETFIQDLDWVNNLRMRVTQGHSGNLGGGSTSDRVVISHSRNAPVTGLPYAMISAPPNTSLKWEDVQMMNYALDFSLFNQKWSGSVEYYTKRITDLISSDPIDPTTGFSVMTRNVAGIQGNGLDINMSFAPITKRIDWRVDAAFSFVEEWTSAFYGNDPNSLTLVSSDQAIRPILERALVPVYSFRFAGLDPENGDPQGILNGEVSKNYTVLLRDSIQHLNYHGSGRPLYHGFLNQTIGYRGFSVFMNIVYRAGHYFKPPTIAYNVLYRTWKGHEAIQDRWQKPGDELRTTIPSMTYPGNTNRDNFYAYSSANVQRGDVVRLQQVRLSYRWLHPFQKIQRIDVSAQVNNLGIIWKSASGRVDPDYLSIPPSRMITTTLSVQF